jgi:hypothetical protein
VGSSSAACRPREVKAAESLVANLISVNRRDKACAGLRLGSTLSGILVSAKDGNSSDQGFFERAPRR